MSLSSIEKYRERVRSIENTPEFLLEKVKLTFAEELCRLLDEQGVSRTQLAERLGTSRAYVTRILRTDYNLTAETMVKVARALDARVELALVPKDAPKRLHATPARVPRRRERKREFVAADGRYGVGRHDFIASDKPAKPRNRKP
jgi:transcriptional regulator with XRE-family HTH domain